MCTSDVKRTFGPCPSSAPAPPLGAPGGGLGSGRLDTPRWGDWGTGRPATAPVARASRLQSCWFHISTAVGSAGTRPQASSFSMMRRARAGCCCTRRLTLAVALAPTLVLTLVPTLTQPTLTLLEPQPTLTVSLTRSLTKHPEPHQGGDPKARCRVRQEGPHHRAAEWPVDSAVLAVPQRAALAARRIRDGPLSRSGPGGEPAMRP